jgi:hypothetical protein
MNDHNELVEKFIASFAVVAETFNAGEILHRLAACDRAADEYGYTHAYALFPIVGQRSTCSHSRYWPILLARDFQDCGNSS